MLFGSCGQAIGGGFLVSGLRRALGSKALEMGVNLGLIPGNAVRADPDRRWELPGLYEAHRMHTAVRMAVSLELRKRLQSHRNPHSYVSGYARRLRRTYAKVALRSRNITW